ncbi:hypothetical protein FB451DRAFT_694186 [Mycena latifolia]|nr:hypothetical protein FB451DRAFT_694186 [Mycena latifolia]
MPAALVKYEERPRSKLLQCKSIVALPSVGMFNPSIARGTLSPSRPESVAFYWVKGAALNIALFLLPLAMGLMALPFLGAPLGLYSHKSPRDLAYFLTYMAVYTGSLLVFGVSMAFPCFFFLVSFDRTFATRSTSPQVPFSLHVPAATCWGLREK